MLKFSANISLLFTELPFPDRFAAAAAAGFNGVEMQFPYDFPAAEIAERARAANVEIVLINAPAGDRSRKEPGIACQPDRIEEFRAGLEIAAEYLHTLHCPRINILCGRVNERNVNLDTLIDNLIYCADTFPSDVTILLEAINGQDVPGYLIQTTAEAIACIQAVQRDRLKLQFDIYHRHISEGDVIGALDQYIAHIGHIQFADAPGRQQPGTGTIDFQSIFKKIDESHYNQWLGAEYVPTNKTSESLDWYQQWH